MVAPSGIVTPEAVVLEFETAGLPSRILAAGIDLLAQGAMLVVFVLAAVGARAAGIELGGFATAFIYLALFFVLFGYPAAMETLWRGRTLGKAALGLRVVTAEGAPIRFRHAAIRAILGLLDKFLLSGAIGVICLLVTSRNQRLGDLVAGTLVLRERSAAKAPSAVTFLPPPGLEGYVAALDVSGLGHEDYAAVRSFLLRATSLAPASRWALGEQLAVPLRHRLRSAPPAGVSPEVFLVCVAAAFQRRNAAIPATSPAPTLPTFSSVWAEPSPGGATTGRRVDAQAAVAEAIAEADAFRAPG